MMRIRPIEVARGFSTVRAYLALPLVMLALTACSLDDMTSPLHDHDHDDDFYGLVESRPSGVAGTWLVRGRTFEASASTRLELDDGPIAVGTCVSVDYEGSRAIEIESEPASACRNL